MAEIFPATEENIAKAARLLKKGGLVAFPTETVYGLGASIDKPEAVARIFEVKQRPFFDPLIVHVYGPGDAPNLAAEINPRAEKLMEKFWPGPLTLVFKKLETVPDIVTAGLPTVAVRMPAKPEALKLIKETGSPLCAPSANLFGKLSPTSADAVRRQIGEKIDIILDGGECEVGMESTVLDARKNFALLRHGGTPLEDIEKIAGKVKIAEGPGAANSPGRLPSHYRPDTPLKIIGKGDFEKIDGENAGLLAFSPDGREVKFKATEILSEKGDLREAARRFFSCLRRLDAMSLGMIYAEAVPEKGLGRAIMERLKKAETKDAGGEK